MNGTCSGAHLLPTFVPEDTAMFHALRKRGADRTTHWNIVDPVAISIEPDQAPIGAEGWRAATLRA